LVHKHYSNLRIPPDTHKPLLVPLVKHPHPKSIFQISHQINQLPLKPPHRKLTSQQIKPPTSTITSIPSPPPQSFTPL
ncbi:2-oxo acid dehydrogenase subunit E2, partial [Staphylococcus epidermidis]|uniref:2-oxo acid dehydrogenase subunit E2 n=1 Tax=Staphylococcus epidermidis TaxID=1282 RepID=UPI001642B1E8